jgi:Fe(3+) dicitrate transport protein
VAETPDARVGRVPGHRVWNLRADWKIPNWTGSDIAVGIDNVGDTRFTRAVWTETRGA